MTSVEISCEILMETRAEIFKLISSAFTDQEKEFLISFKKGEPRWDLISIENIQHFPSVKWKLHNIQNMIQTKRHQALVLLEKNLQG